MSPSIFVFEMYVRVSTLGRKIMKDDRLQLRISEEEKTFLQAVAMARRLSLSKLVRTCTLEGARAWLSEHSPTQAEEEFNDVPH